MVNIKKEKMNTLQGRKLRGSNLYNDKVGLLREDAEKAYLS